VAIDANVLIYLLEDDPDLGDRAQALLDAIADGGLEGRMSAVALTEVLVGPARSGDTAGFESLADEIRSLPLMVIPIDARTAEDAAWIRGQAGLDLADSIHVAAARASGATALVTNDRRIRSRPQLEVVYLDELEPTA
jgi:predicted nucleic acid-binding protein